MRELTLTLLVVLVVLASARADNKTENALREQLAQTQAELVTANKAAQKLNTEGLAISKQNAALLAAAAANAARQAVLAASRNEAAIHQREAATDAVNTNADDASAHAQLQADIAKQAADNAERAATTARDQATTASAGIKSLSIIQAFTFLSLVAGFFYKAWEHNQDTKEVRRKEELADKERKLAVDTAATVTRSTTARLDQIHTLVNSNLTSALQGELDSRRENLVLLESAIQSQRALGHEPSADTEAIISGAKLRIAELNTTIIDRKIQTSTAEKQRMLELNKSN